MNARLVHIRAHGIANWRAVANADAIEWEELPSLAGSLDRCLVPRGSWQPGSAQPFGTDDSAFLDSTGFGAAPRDNTLPATLDPAPVSQPFLESLAGLSAGEVNEPGVFLHFFGPNAAEH